MAGTALSAIRGAVRRWPTGRSASRSASLLVATALAVLLAACGSGLPAPSPTSFPAGPSSQASRSADPTGSVAVPAPTTASTSPSASPAATASPPSAAPQTRSAADPALDRQTATALQATFAVAARRLGVPGAQATILFADGQAWQGAYGWADQAAQRPMTAADVFDVGSITKTFIAADVLELAEEGRLGLDDRLARWLPHVPNAAAITVRELLSHTSGLADYLADPRLLRALDADHTRRWTPAALLAYVGRPLFSPGTGWSYSNTNYLLLGMIVAAVEGRSVEASLEARFFGPLDLAQTALQPATAPPPSAFLGPVAVPYAPGSRPGAPAFALGTGSGYLPYASLATALDTAGSLVSSSTDLARWAAALYGGQVLPGGWLATMLDDQVTRRFHPPRDYALGVEHKTLAGLTTVGHSGACSGYRSAMRYVPALGASVVVLVNEDVIDPDTITTALIAALESAGRSGPVGL